MYTKDIVISAVYANHLALLRSPSEKGYCWQCLGVPSMEKFIIFYLYVTVQLVLDFL